MKIKEKIAEIILVPFHNQGFYIDLDKVEKCEQIAEEFAIGFAEWLYKWDNTRLPNGNWIIGLGLKPLTSKEVLEIYKKEKGL